MKIGIVGGGVAGLFTAWHLGKAGEEVHLFEQGRIGQGCSWDAAGMLAPVNELEFQELALLRAGVASREIYKAIGPDLGDIGLEEAGTLEIGLSKDDEGYLRRLFDFQQSNGLPVKWLRSHEVQDYEPFASRNIPFAIWSPEDIQVDNRKLIPQLAKENLAMGMQLFEQEEVVSWNINESGKVELRTKARTETFDALVVAVGTGKIEGLKLPYAIYPVRGEMLSLLPPEGDFLQKTIRIRNKTLGNAYVVPKAGRILCGSTSEEQGRAAWNTAGGLLDILRKCYAAVPGIYELQVAEQWAGLRPSTLSRQPIIDREPDRPIYHINGLYRHGILLSPLAGKAIATLMLENHRLPEIEEFRIG